mmetsp:Transcript_6014/g.20530  ORF Transcript_6014/g.20530 Transcript_6014/m.20530 type:complete len:251 (+) Transcript_6014:2771-3523(+)
MSILLGEKVPNFVAPSSDGDIDWHKFIQGSWAILFSHPADYTPVCTTELGTVASFSDEFKKRGVKVAALSCNDADSHKGWIKDINTTSYAKGATVDFPIIADPDRTIAKQYGMIDPEEKSATGLPMTCRAVFIIGPDATLKLGMLYPATTGRNFDEILRVVDSLQLTAKHKVATPANWRSGQSCMVTPPVSDEVANKTLGGFKVMEVPSGKRYIRITADPSGKKAPNAIMKFLPTIAAAVVGLFAGKALK